jgi:hypothetical protein
MNEKYSGEIVKVTLTLNLVIPNGEDEGCLLTDLENAVEKLPHVVFGSVEGQIDTLAP